MAEGGFDPSQDPCYSDDEEVREIIERAENEGLQDDLSSPSYLSFDDYSDYDSDIEVEKYEARKRREERAKEEGSLRQEAGAHARDARDRDSQSTHGAAQRPPADSSETALLIDAGAYSKSRRARPSSSKPIPRSKRDPPPSLPPRISSLRPRSSDSSLSRQQRSNSLELLEQPEKQEKPEQPDPYRSLDRPRNHLRDLYDNEGELSRLQQKFKSLGLEVKPRPTVEEIRIRDSTLQRHDSGGQTGRLEKKKSQSLQLLDQPEPYTSRVSTFQTPHSDRQARSLHRLRSQSLEFLDEPEPYIELPSVADTRRRLQQRSQSSDRLDQPEPYMGLPRSRDSSTSLQQRSQSSDRLEQREPYMGLPRSTDSSTSSLQQRSQSTEQLEQPETYMYVPPDSRVSTFQPHGAAGQTRSLPRPSRAAPPKSPPRSVATPSPSSSSSYVRSTSPQPPDPSDSLYPLRSASPTPVRPVPPPPVSQRLPEPPASWIRRKKPPSFTHKMKKIDRKAKKKFKETRIRLQQRAEVIEGVTPPSMVGPINYVNQIIEKLEQMQAIIERMHQITHRDSAHQRILACRQLYKELRNLYDRCMVMEESHVREAMDRGIRQCEQVLMDDGAELHTMQVFGSLTLLPINDYLLGLLRSWQVENNRDASFREQVNRYEQELASQDSQERLQTARNTMRQQDPDKPENRKA